MFHHDPFDYLSDDLLSEIVTRLPFDSISRFAKTNKRVHEFCLAKTHKQKIIWRSIMTRTYQKVPQYKDISKLSETASGYLTYIRAFCLLDPVSQGLVCIRRGEQELLQELNLDRAQQAMIDVLLDKKPIRFSLFFPMMYWSAKFGHLSIIKYLYKNGADLNIRNGWLLRVASESGHLDMVRFLVDRNVNIHGVNEWALIKSIEKGHAKVVKYLLEKGAHANIWAIRKASQDPEIYQILQDR